MGSFPNKQSLEKIKIVKTFEDLQIFSDDA